MNGIDLNKMFQVLVDNSDNEFFNFVRDNIKELKNYSFDLANELYKIPYSKSTCEDYYSFIDSIEITKGFLNSVNPIYVNDFEKIINDGTLSLTENDEKEYDYMDYTITPNNNIICEIKVKPKNTIEDVYVLIHEFFHSTNVSKNNKLDRCLLTESVSVLYEFLLYDYLIKNNISKMDNVVIMIENINHIIDRCDYLYDELVTMEKALSNINEINSFDLINEEDKNESDHDFYEGVDKLTNYIRKDVKYVISGVIAVIIYYRYKNDYIKMDSIYDFNNSIKTTEELDSLKILFSEKPSKNEIVKACEYLKNDILSNFNSKTK